MEKHPQRELEISSDVMYINKFSPIFSGECYMFPQIWEPTGCFFLNTFETAAQGAQSGQSMDAETEIQVMRDVVKDGICGKGTYPMLENQKKAKNMDVYWVFNDLYQRI